MSNAATCNGLRISYFNRHLTRWIFQIPCQEYLPNIAEVMAFTWRFNPESSSATGLRAGLASSACFSNVPFSVSQLARSVLNSSFSRSMEVKAARSSSLALDDSSWWDLILSWRSAICVRWWFMSACQHQRSTSIFYQKSQAYNWFYTWHLGANADCFFLIAYSKSQGFIQVSILALGG